MGSSAGARCLASPHSATGRREGVFAVRCGNHFLVATLMQSFRPDGVHGIQVATAVEVHHTEGVHRIFRSQKIKSRSLFQINKISRDVKGLFLGVRFVSSRVIVQLQLEDELHVQVGCSVRRVNGLLGLSPLGLISRLLRGQVRHLLYIRRGDVSI
jgi:hypothetical protein